MRRPAVLFLLAALLVLAHAASSLAGGAEHTSVVAGMPLSSASWMLGPAHVGLYLVLVIVAPVLALAGTFDTILILREASSDRRTNEAIEDAPDLVDGGG